MPLVDWLDAQAVIVGSSEPATAARLLGMADRLRAEARLGVWHAAKHDRTIATVRTAIGDGWYARLHAEGHALSLPAIVEAVSRPATG